MSRELSVYLHNELVGIYRQDKHGKKSFQYDPLYIARPSAIPLSHSLPLQTEAFGDKLCHSFFGGILPEETQRRLVAKIFGVSADNDFSILEKIGGECAGAISLYPYGARQHNISNNYLELSDADLLHRIHELPTHPLLLGCDDMRLSLAGVQDKITLAIADGRIYLPLRGAPSTHILKPEIGYNPSTVINEAFCLKLAKSIGLNVIDCSIGTAKDLKYLLVTRYDRSGMLPDITRIQQEDFCQALSIASEQKYQAEGGPTLTQCFDLVRETSSAPVLDIAFLLDAVIYNFIIGNCDAHGKNFSMLYKNNKSIRLAPLYDLLSTVVYPKLSTKMAMKIGDEYDLNKIRLKHFVKFADNTGLNSKMVLERITEISEKILFKIPELYLEQNHFAEEISSIIIKRAQLVKSW